MFEFNYVAVYVSLEIKFQCLVKQRILVVFLLVEVLLPKERVFSNQHCMISIAYDEIRSNRVCATEGYAILLRSTSYLYQVLRTYQSKHLKSVAICQGTKYTSQIITTTLK